MQLMVFVGLASSELDDAILEWFSRCGAWLAIAATAWLVAGVLVFYLADVVEMGVTAIDHMLAMRHTASSAMVATLVPLLSSLAGIAARASGATDKPSTLRLMFQRLALPAIIVVLLSTIAWVDLRASQAIEYHRLDATTLCTPDSAPPCHLPGAGMGENVIIGLSFSSPASS